MKFTDGPVNGDVQQTEKFRYGVMGKAFQTPLGHSGDHTTIDWGYLYLAGCGPEARFAYDSEKERLDGIVELGTESESGGIVAAYDDLVPSTISASGERLIGQRNIPRFSTPSEPASMSGRTC